MANFRQTLVMEEPWASDDNGIFRAKHGRDYLVYELNYRPASGLWVTVLSELSTYLSCLPICMFTIMSGRASREWVLEQGAEGDWVLGPPALREPFFADDYSEDVDAVVEKLNALTARMRGEEELGE